MLRWNLPVSYADTENILRNKKRKNKKLKECIKIWMGVTVSVFVLRHILQFHKKNDLLLLHGRPFKGGGVGWGVGRGGQTP